MNQESTNVVPAVHEQTPTSVYPIPAEFSQPDQTSIPKPEESYEALSSALESGDFENVT